jgi:hypothetical protein
MRDLQIAVRDRREPRRAAGASAPSVPGRAPPVRGVRDCISFFNLFDRQNIFSKFFDSIHDQ